MKIALFVPSLRGGGAERAAVNIANYLVGHGQELQFVAADADGQFRGDLSTDVPLINFKSPRVSQALLHLVRYFRKEKPDVMLSFQTRANILAIIARNLSGNNTKIVVREGNTASASLRDSGLIQNRILYWLIPRIYTQADGIVAISRGVRDDLAGILPSKDIQVIYNPAVRADIPQMAADPVQHPFYGSNGPPVILSVGRLAAQKDHQTLIKAFAKLNKQISARLVILGEGKQRQNLEAIITENGLQDVVSLPGFVPNPYTFMAKSTVFVLSSLWEGFGIVLAEALACGVPVISTDCPSGPAEILDGGKYGSLVPMGDVDALAERILATIQNPPDIRFGIERSKQFSVDIGAQNYLDLFKALVEA